MKSGKVLHRICAAFLMLAVAFGMMLTPFTTIVNADGENAAVTEDKKGVLQVKVVYVDDSNTAHDIQSGTAFLINDTTAITADHVVSVADETMQQIAELWGNGKTADQCRGKLQIVINVLRDNTMTATIKTSSYELDVAVLSLQQAINNRSYLKIRKSSQVAQTEICYALGFPAEFDTLEPVQTFTSEDVTISNGQVSKLNRITTSRGTVDYVVTNAKITSGFSGGPLVDNNGNVIGVLNGSTSENVFDQDYYYSVSTDEIINILDSWGIDFTASDAVPAPATPETSVPDTTTPTVDKTALNAALTEANALNLGNYTAETGDALALAMESARTVSNNINATQADVDKALSDLNAAKTALVEKKPGLPGWLIGVIAAGVVAVIGLIAFLASRGKKKSTPVYDAPVQSAPAAPATPAYNETPAAPVPPTSYAQYEGGNETTVLGGTAGETTVLGGTAGETTVLSAKTYGTLTRKKNGETVSINKDHFRIGRERNNVDYCISDNTNVGRLHAEIVSNGSKTFVVDKHSTNSTFVNDVKCVAGQQVELADGDRIAFADEEYTFKKL